MQNIRRHGHDPCDLEADVRSQDPCDLEAHKARYEAITRKTTGQSASAVSFRTATKVNVRDFTHVEYIS